MHETTLKTKEVKMFLKNRCIPAFLILAMCACYGESTKVKQMEGFDEALFYKRYYGKEPVIITKLGEKFKTTSTKLFQRCSDQKVGLVKLPSMQEFGDTISLINAFRPCGIGCYGVLEEPICEEALKDSETMFNSDTENFWFSVVQKDIETPATITEGHYFRYLSAGVEDWRLLTRFEDATIDLFVQQAYSMKLTTGDLLYVPPTTLMQHAALTPLSVAVGSS